MIRRTSWRYYHRDHLEIAEQVARWMAEFFGWDDDRVRREITEYRQVIDESSNCAFDDAEHAGVANTPASAQQSQQQQVQPA
jgi:hypothetical protein